MNTEEIVDSLKVYENRRNMYKGKRVYNNGLVSDLTIKVYEDEAHLIQATVSSEASGSEYDVDFSFDLYDGEIFDTDCNCPDFYSNNNWNGDYICKHIAALYYAYIDRLEGHNDNLNEKSLDRISEYFLDGIENMQSPKEKVNIEVSLDIVKKYNNEYFEANFKIGTKKMYVVKSLRDLIQSINKNTILAYGKGFVFDPKIHEFKEIDAKIIEFVEDYIVTKDTYMSDYGGYYQNKVKSLKISPTSIRRFLELICDKEITGTNADLKIIKGDIPLQLKMGVEEERISLEILGDKVTPLNTKFDVLSYDGNIYLPSEKQSKSLKILLSCTQKENKILFKKDNANRIFNSVVPMLENSSKTLEFEDTLKEFERENLEPSFYFDENRKEITLEVKLKYGENILSFIESENEGKIIIRDTNKEQEILRSVENLNISLHGKRFIFNGDEDSLYDLLTEGYKTLENFGDVYYSERFKNRKVYKTPKINAGIRESDDGYLDFSFNIEEINPKEYKNILESFRNNKRYHKLKDNSFINLQDNNIKDVLDMVDKMVTSEKNIDNLRLHKNRSVLLNEYVNRKELDFVNGTKIIKDTVNTLQNIKEVDCKIPDDLDATLREYQIEGYKWFKNLSNLGFGGVLADEMGLGKTIQAITFILSEKGKKTLIVAPTSLIYNWKNEFEKFAPKLKLAIVHGNKDERKKVINDYKDYDVILTTYGTLRNDEEEYKDIVFDYCIIDEAQNIKNPMAQASKSIKEIKAKTKFALTGTPIENNLIELWSIFDFVMPGYLYNNAIFTKKFTGGEDSFKELQKYIKPFMLRRLKKEVILELPDKIEKKHYVELNKEQQKVYSAYVKDIKEKMEDESFEGDKITIFSYLTKLRQLCLEPSLLIEGYKGGNGKLEAALEIINNAIENGHKILLFSQFTSVLSVIQSALEKDNIKYSYLDGKTKASKRLELVDEFNNDEDTKLFLISLKAGGTGLNLTSADIVIHFDPWWNPSIEEQASDRAHRMGQKNVVEVIKLIAQGTIEERIIKLQDDKKELINNVMSGGYESGNVLSTLSNKELMDLFI